MEFLPDAAKHHPDPAYVEKLYAQIGEPMTAIAALLGLSERTLRCYKSTGPSRLDMPYSVQFCLESLAGATRSQHDRTAAAPRRNGRTALRSS